MISQFMSLLSGLVALIIYMAIFLGLMRLQRRLGWFTLQIILGISIHVLSALLSSLFLQEYVYWYAVGIYSVGWFFFFVLSTAIYVSISARILRTITHQPGASLPLEEIYQRCIREPYRERAEILTESGLAQKGDIGYKITDAGRKTARRVQWMRRVFGMEGSGLYGGRKG
jgi:hypothetical protein